jgi:hypothetical protein
MIRTAGAELLTLVYVSEVRSDLINKVQRLEGNLSVRQAVKYY